MDNHKGDLGGKRTLVEEGTQFKGSLSSSCPIVVRGKIDGDISAPSLQVSSTGSVHGKVKVGEIESQGELSGEFDADVIQLSGTVKDKTIVRAKSLEVKLAPATGKMQVVFGECVLDVGDMPSKEAAISSARESDRPANGGAAEANGNGRNGSGEPTKDVLPGLSAEALAEHADESRKAKSGPPKRA
jgi:cytoskeletal protein CcmA (bactofilin family)